METVKRRQIGNAVIVSGAMVLVAAIPVMFGHSLRATKLEEKRVLEKCEVSLTVGGHKLTGDDAKTIIDKSELLRLCRKQ